MLREFPIKKRTAPTQYILFRDLQFKLQKSRDLSAPNQFVVAPTWDYVQGNKHKLRNLCRVVDW